jgi:hypothetical protein
MSATALSFFSTSLKESQVREDVTIAGQVYEVVEGEVHTASATTISEETQFEALTLAYAKTVLRRSPLLTLEGVDLDAFQEGVDNLESSAGALAIRMSEPTLTEVLFPIQFLRILKEVELARRAFLTSGKEEDLFRYSSLLEQATLQGKEETLPLQALMEQIIPDNSFYAFPAGTLSKSNLINALGSIRQALDMVRTLFLSLLNMTSGQ